MRTKLYIYVFFVFKDNMTGAILEQKYIWYTFWFFVLIWVIWLFVYYCWYYVLFVLFFLYKVNHSNGIMISVLASSAVGRLFDARSSQTIL
jgi:hypothetical protein